MHREWNPAESPLKPRGQGALYFFTLVLGVLFIADLWPQLAKWLTESIYPTPTWTTTSIFGFRFALIVAVLGGARVLYGSLEKLGEGRIGADITVALACIAAIIIGQPLVAAEVVFIGLVGECLEAFTFDRTQRALGKLTELFPRRVWVLREGTEVRISTGEILVGDRVVVKPGGRVPVDGTVVDGTSEIDTSALTGESLPREVSRGAKMLAGSLVKHGSLTIAAEKLDRETVAGKVMALTAAALQNKSKGERLADRLARWFLPIVLGLALVVFIVNIGIQQSGGAPDTKKLSLGAAARLAAYPALAVLVVACPCPLVLATPAAVMAALARLAGTGVLIKSGAALERLAEVRGFAFDKTGTLTLGQLESGDLRPHSGVSELELLDVAAIAESKSEHPLAALILKEASRRQFVVREAEEFTAFPGGGVRAKQGEQEIFVGTLRFLSEQGFPVELDAELAHFDATGQTPLFVVRNGQYLGSIGARDAARPEAVGVLAELAELGLAPPLILSGDRGGAVGHVANDLGIAEYRSELLPAQKAEAIEKLGYAVAFVGDGINDAPALAAASVGIAIGIGADLAAHTGDVILMGEPLRSLPLLVRLSRATAKIIRQNIVGFGFGLNGVGIVLTGLLWPLFAPDPEWYERAPLAGAIFHQLGSLLVLLNSMRLLAFERNSGARAKRASETVDRWVNAVHFDHLFHEVTHRWKAVLGAAIGIAVAGWLSTGIAVIEANEVGVVQCFGAVRDDLQPGLNIRWPYPTETVTRVRPAEIRTVEIGFRILPEEQIQRLGQARIEQNKLKRIGAKNDGGLTWSSAHSEEIARQTDESLMLTGDGDLVELLATIRFTISDPKQFLFGGRQPDATIRSVAESVFRELIAGRKFQDLLGSGRPDFERAAAGKIIARLNEAAPEGLGIRIVGLAIHDLHPPQEVVSAYHAVADAIQKRDTAINTALSDSARMKARAGDDALRTVRAAEAEGHRKEMEATAGRDVLLSWQAARTSLPPEEEMRFNAITEERVKAGQPRDVATVDVHKLKLEAINARRTLTDFRLGLAAVVAVLKTRDKILIDADKLPGSRKLYLLDPDLMPRTPTGLPLAFPRDQREKDPP